MKTKNSKWLPLLLFVAILALLAIIFYDLFPLFRELLKNRSDETKTVSYINAYGAKAVPVLALLQLLQVVVGFFPAALIQVLAGLCYGVWRGAFICLAGCIAGNMLVFFLVRQFRSRLYSFMPRRKGGAHKTKQSKWLNANKIKQMQHPEVIAFFLYLIPGIPNGILPYLFAQTTITFPQYLISITTASIPSMLLCTWIGKSISQGNYRLAVILVLVMAALLLLVFLLRGKLFAILDRHFNRKTV